MAVVSASLLFCAPALAAAWWQPPQQLTWYWQLTGTPLVEPVDATDIDGFDTTASTVSAFHSRGQHVICYIDVGTAENWRPDYGQFPAADLGSDNGWPGEKWLNIADPAIRPIMAARFQMCQQKGFDAVEPDNMDGYENSTGFSISASQQAAYDEWVAQEVHSLGMAVFQKNDPEQAATLQPSFDGALDEQCNEYSECSSFAPYVSAGQAGAGCRVPVLAVSRVLFRGRRRPHHGRALRRGTRRLDVQAVLRPEHDIRCSVGPRRWRAAVTRAREAQGQCLGW